MICLNWKVRLANTKCYNDSETNCCTKCSVYIISDPLFHTFFYKVLWGVMCYCLYPFDAIVTIQWLLSQLILLKMALAITCSKNRE